MTVRNYSNTASQSTLTASIGATDTSIALAGYAGDPTPPFTAALARGTATEEIILVTAVVGSTVTVTRGYDGTSAQAQAAGATFQEVVVAVDFREANNHVNTVGAVHGVSSQLVGVSDTQTLTNKTLTAPQVSALTGTGTTTLAAVTATTLTVSGASTLTTVTATTLTVSGASTVAALTASGAVKAPTVETTTAVLLDQQASDPATPAPAGQTALWKAADHGIYLVGSTAGKRRTVVHWGSGTVLPSAALAGDTFFYTGLCLLRYDGVNWRQGATCEVASQTARDALPTTPLYAGFRVLQSNNGWEWTYTAPGWRLSGLLGTPPAFFASVAAFSTAGDANTHTVTGFAAPTDTSGGLVSFNVTTGILTFNANARVSLAAQFTSDSPSARYSSVALTTPPSVGSGLSAWDDYVESPAGFAGGGTLIQQVGGTVNVVSGDAVHMTTRSYPVAVSYAANLFIDFL